MVMALLSRSNAQAISISALLRLSKIRLLIGIMNCGPRASCNNRRAFLPKTKRYLSSIGQAIQLNDVVYFR